MISSILLALHISTAVASASPSPQAMPTPQHLAIIVARAPKAVLRLQVARTEPQRERGLMAVTQLPRHTGMLFVFDADGPVSFWMKDTLISLDMVFIAPDGIVRRVYPKVRVVSPSLPDIDIPIESGTAQFVIELPAGEAMKDGIKSGVRIALPQSARTP